MEECMLNDAKNVHSHITNVFENTNVVGLGGTFTFNLTYIDWLDITQGNIMTQEFFTALNKELLLDGMFLICVNDKMIVTKVDGFHLSLDSFNLLKKR